jgi:hypothetical protein
MAICAFCDQSFSKLTREHLFPASLHQRISAANEALYGCANVSYLGRIDATIASEPQIKDVCASCNNGTLSSLDAYICQLWDQYFYRIAEAGEQVSFRYDYHLLARWLLKTCFNSARIHMSDVAHLKKCRDYIRFGERHPDHVVIHLQLSVPTKLSEDQRSWALSQGLDVSAYEPRLNRVGHLNYRTRFGYFRVTRAVHLQSFVFIVHLFPDKADTRQRSQELQDFAARLPNARRLSVRDCTSSTQLVCKGLDSIASIGSHFAMKESPTN